MEKTAAVLTLFMILPVALGANPYGKLLKDTTEDVAPIKPENVAVEKTMLLEQAKPSDVGDVKCPDGSTCSDGNTCCLHINGGFACCPDANGNCCDDYMTCCKSGQVCDDANDQCINPSVDVLDRITFLLKSSSTQRKL